MSKDEKLKNTDYHVKNVGEVHKSEKKITLKI